MELQDLITRFSSSRELQVKAIFSSLFIVGNKLQTFFDNDASEVTLKQFMLLTMIHQSKKPLTFTQLGSLLGCSRQNIKKIAQVLEQKGYVNIKKSEIDSRASCLEPTKKMNSYFDEVALLHTKQLQGIFCLYSDEEIEQLFSLFMKMHQSMEFIEKGGSSAKAKKD